MSSAQFPHQQDIRATSATDGGRAFAGVNLGTMNYGETVREPSPYRAPPKPFSTVPFRDDNDFVERGDVLTQVDRRCSQPAGRAALVGLGGVGKSRLAIRYAHSVRRRSPETWVFWIHASTTPRVESAYKEIADRLALPGRHDSTANVPMLVVKWLSDEANGPWLIIIDSADDFRVMDSPAEGSKEKPLFANLVPQSSNGAVLITSRSMDMARAIVGRDKDIIKVGPMNKDEAAELLNNELGKPADEHTADLLAVLEYFPLAITQAAYYINRQPGMSVATYLQRLQTAGWKTRLLQKAAADVRRDKEASNSILATWQISFEHIRSERPSAADLLSFMSFFSPQGIPGFMLRYYKMRDEGESSQETNSRVQETDNDYEEDIALLHSFSLITRTKFEDEFKMHDLVQFATRVWLSSTDAEEEWWGRFVSAMVANYPRPKYKNWAICRTLLPHVRSIAERKPQEEHRWKRKQVLGNASIYARDQGLFLQAEEMARQALAVDEKLEKGDPETLWIMNNLGIALNKQGKYKEAEEMHRHVLAVRKKTHRKDHPAAIESMNNLASALARQEKYEEAEEMRRHVLAVNKEAVGEDHPVTIVSMGNLATTLTKQKKDEEAIELYRRALTMAEKTIGKQDPHALAILNNSAWAYRTQGRWVEAEELIMQAIEGRTKLLGAEHPDTLESINGHAFTLKGKGEDKKAIVLMEGCLEVRRRVLGPDHADTKQSEDALNKWLMEGRYLGSSRKKAPASAAVK